MQRRPASGERDEVRTRYREPCNSGRLGYAGQYHILYLVTCGVIIEDLVVWHQRLPHLEQRASPRDFHIIHSLYLRYLVPWYQDNTRGSRLVLRRCRATVTRQQGYKHPVFRVAIQMVDCRPYSIE